MTKIEWANRTWNPVTGCTRVSEGCDHCYMHRMYPRLKGFGTPGYSLEPDMIEEMPDRLGQPMLWKKPARIFRVKGVDKTYQWGGAKMYHQRGHWPA